MPRKSPQGGYILSAGEIGSYTVCPKAWQLKELAYARENASHLKRSGKGEELHQRWSHGQDDVIFLTRGIRIVVFLIIFTMLIFELVVK